MRNIILSLFLLLSIFSCSQQNIEKRKTISLNGSWQIAQSIDDKIPDSFPSVIHVPGLIDLAIPAFDSVGVTSSQRNYFWYKTNFKVDSESYKLAFLKFHKTKYGLKAWLNGNEIGENMLNFTPAKFQADKF